MSSHDHPGSVSTSNELVPSTGNSSDSSSSTILRDPDRDQRVEDVAEVLRKEQGEVRDQDESGHGMSINILSDDVLLEIFDDYRKDQNRSLDISVWRWHTLVHVCQRWRQIIFGSPRSLDLQILCTNGNPVRESLDIWPPFPIVVKHNYDRTFTQYDADNLVAALEHPGRICQINLCLPSLQLGEAAAVMQQPFPELTHLDLQWVDERPPAFPSGFLGGSTPRLQQLHLNGIHFPELPALLLSTGDLVHLDLGNIHFGSNISPESMVACLAALPRLKSFYIEYLSATPHTDHTLPPPAIRTSLPALTYFGFQGYSKYMEDLLVRLDSPRLNLVHINYFDQHWNQFIDLQVVQLFKFIDRSEDPGLSLIRHMDVSFSARAVNFEMYPRPESSRQCDRVAISYESELIDRQVSLVAHVFGQPSTILSRVVHLKLSEYPDDGDYYSDEWLPLLWQFSTIRTLHVSREIAGYIALALENVTGGMVVEVLPVVDLIYLEGQPVSCVERFLASRELSGHPVTIVQTQAEFDERIKSYVD